MTNGSENQRSRRRPSAVTSVFLLCGLWLIASPWVLGFAWAPAAWANALIVGVAMTVLGVVRYTNPHRFDGVRWTALILGGWLVASPFFGEFFEVTVALWNALIVGAVIFFGAIVAAARPAHHEEAKKQA